MSRKKSSFRTEKLESRYLLAATAAIGTFTATPNPDQPSQSITLTASNVTDSGTLNGVSFYWETGAAYGLQTSGLNADTLLFTKTSTPYVYTFPSSSFPVGGNLFYAVAVDNIAGNNSAPAGAAVVIQSAASGSISGTIFHDANGNGTFDGGESGLSGWTVYLDATQSGQYVNSDLSTTTNSNGQYTFSGLEPGTYTVAVQLQSGYVQTTPAGGSFIGVQNIAHASQTANSSSSVISPAGGSKQPSAATSPGDSISSQMMGYFLQAAGNGTVAPDGSSGPNGYTPSRIRSAYGLNLVSFGSTPADGTGQTIAIVDSYDSPTIAADLHQFDVTFGLPDPPSFTRVAQDGSINYPPTDPSSPNPNGSWEMETALDVEWSHALAPGANILLVEANDNNSDNLYTAVEYAAAQAGVSVISMSWGGGEDFTDTSSDPTFTTPNGHNGVTFIASAGDNGAYSSSTTLGVEYPAASPNVLSIGGTALSLSGNAYSSETAWGSGTTTFAAFGTGGGISAYEPQPTYQLNAYPMQSTANRTVPDVAFDAKPNTGVPIYDSYDNGGNTTPWTQIGGTSMGSPSWAAIIAIVNQGRVLNGKGTLDGPTQTIPALYRLNSADFHDITSGDNGYAAGTGYDLDTGRGTPLTNLLIPDLVSAFTATGGEYTVTLTTTTSSVTGENFGAFPTIYSTSASGSAYTVRLSSGGADLQVLLNNTLQDSTPVGLAPSLTFTLTGANDSLTIDTTNGNPIPTSGGITYTGNAGAFSILGSTSSANTFAINATQITWNTAAPITYSGLASIAFTGGAGNDSLTQNAQPGAAVSFAGGAGADSITVNAGTYAFNSDPSLTTASLSLNLNNAATATFVGAAVSTGSPHPFQFAALNLRNNSSAVAGAAVDSADRSVLVLGALTFGSSGTWQGLLDLGGNDMILEYAGFSVAEATLGTIQSQIVAGRGSAGGLAGQWNGTSGITSSAAAAVYANSSAELASLGYAVNSNVQGSSTDLGDLGLKAFTTYDGVAVSSGDILIKYTHMADAILDDLADLNAITKLAGNYNATGAYYWADGDFNDDGEVNLTDVTLLAGSYQNTNGVVVSPSLAPAYAPSFAPAVEPVSKRQGQARTLGASFAPAVLPASTASTANQNQQPDSLFADSPIATWDLSGRLTSHAANARVA